MFKMTDFSKTEKKGSEINAKVLNDNYLQVMDA